MLKFPQGLCTIVDQAAKQAGILSETDGKQPWGQQGWYWVTRSAVEAQILLEELAPAWAPEQVHRGTVAPFRCVGHSFAK